MSLREFGRQQGLSYNSLQYWRRKFGTEVPKRRLRKRSRPGGADLVPVHVLADREITSSGQAFELRFSNGVSVGVLPGFDGGELRRLIQVVSSC